MGVFLAVLSFFAARSARAETDSIWYARVGAGALAQRGLAIGPAFGFGWRYAMDHVAIDASLFNFVLTKKGATFDNLSGSWLKLGLLYYFDPHAYASFYGGAAAAWGVTSAEADAVHYANSGLDFGLTLGYETARTNTVRLFIQADVDLPAYASHGNVPTAAGGMIGLTKDSMYTPSFALSIGIGAGRPKAPPPAAD